MTSVIVVGLVLFVIVLIAIVALAPGPGRRRRTADRQQLIDELFIADGELQSAHRRTRQQMNDAASQSWRNLTG